MTTAAFDWRRALTPDEYRVLREKATEPARSGEYNDLYPSEGYFVCRGCKNPLFSAAAKYKSGCGWPSFDRCYVGSLRVQPDFSHGDQRVEIVCTQCDGHLGHLFSGEHHTESDQRHCVNSRSIKFIKSPPPAELLAVGESTVDTTAVERQLAAHVPAPNGRLADVRPRSDLDLSDPELAAAWAETRALASGWCVCTYAEGSKTQIVPIARGSDGFDGLRAALLEDAINYGVLPLRVDERPRHIFFCYVGERTTGVKRGRAAMHAPHLEKFFVGTIGMLPTLTAAVELIPSHLNSVLLDVCKAASSVEVVRSGGAVVGAARAVAERVTRSHRSPERVTRSHRSPDSERAAAAARAQAAARAAVASKADAPFLAPSGGNAFKMAARAQVQGTVAPILSPPRDRSTPKTTPKTTPILSPPRDRSTSKPPTEALLMDMPSWAIAPMAAAARCLPCFLPPPPTPRLSLPMRHPTTRGSTHLRANTEIQDSLHVLQDSSHKDEAENLHMLQLLDGDGGAPALTLREGPHDPLNTLSRDAIELDQTGCQLWGAALVLARWIAVDERVRAVLEGACVVELGAGCGLPGLAAAVYARSRRVVLTDLNALTLANLRANVLANADACSAAGCSVEVLRLPWASSWAAAAASAAAGPATPKTTPKTQVQPFIVGEPVDIVLGSDLAYRTENVRLLGARVRALLATGGIFLHVSAPVRCDLTHELLHDGAFALEAQFSSDEGAFGAHLRESTNVGCRHHPSATHPAATPQAAQATRCGQEFLDIRSRPFLMQWFRRL